MRRYLLLFGLLVVIQGSFANQALRDLENAMRLAFSKNSLTEIKSELNNYYLVFIYKSKCPHCKQFAPNLKSFSHKFGLKVKAYSLDAGSLTGFTSNKLTPELFRTFFLSSGIKPMVPALFLINKDTLQGYPVLFGNAEPYLLAERMDILLKHIKEQFNG